MEYRIPQLLLTIPAPVIDDAAFDEKGRLQLSLDEAEQKRSEYFAQVALHLRRHALSMEEEVTPAVECALRLFNAENFSGELSPVERAHFGEVYRRFGAPSPGEVSETTPAEVDNELAAETGKPIFAASKDAYMQRLLTSNGEMANACVRLGGLLLCVLAMVTAREGEDADTGAFLFPYTNPWRLRAHMRHQLCLLHRAHAVFLEISACIDAVMAQPESALTVPALLEVGHAQGYYHHRELATQTFRRAMALSGLRVEEDAMMGVRTRWQQQQYVQMVLNATSAREVPETSTTEEQPKVIMRELDGHDLLDRPRESPDGAAPTVAPLHPEDKAIILALCMDIRNHNPFHGLTQHHMQTYVERLLADPAPAPFMIQCQTLLVRSRLEAKRNRVQERSFLQMTELVDQYSARRDPSHTRFTRTSSDYFYTVAYPPVWALKSEYADTCFEENLFKTALEVYEEVRDWEKINECCKKLDKRRRAELLARELLERDPSNPLLWVALGEATHDDAHLWHAWELCGHRMAAPMRALARLALAREHYDKVVQYFDEAVRINPVFGGDWFTLGYASLKLQNWERGGEAFTRVCQMDPADAFGWNNLASVMLRLGRVRPAFNAMSQALRNNRRDWRMWQNYFQIGCQLKEVTETTNALNIAATIAKRNLQLDQETMNRFVDNTIAYLNGDIPGSSADAEEELEVRGTDAVTYRSMTGATSVREAARPESIAHLPVGGSPGQPSAGDEQDSEESALASLVPLGADEDLSTEEVYAAALGASGPRASPAVPAEAQAGIRRRHGERVRALFTSLLEQFVSDEDLYGCAARYFGFLDGSMAAYHYRLRELRACQQKDQWSRDPARFARTVKCLQAMAGDATAACAAVLQAQEQTPTAVGEGGVGQTQKALPEPAEVIAALKDTQGNVQAALDAAEEHMEGTEPYDALRALSKSLRSTVQEAKAAFV